MSMSKQMYICSNGEKCGSIYVLFYVLFMISLLMTRFSSSASAKIIWRIGEDDGKSLEFGLPGSTMSDPAIDQEAVPFSPPNDPNSFDWQSFPCNIWPPETFLNLNPKEIHIIYDYPKDFRCPILRIKAKSALRAFTQGLVVSKGGINLSQDLGLPSFYTTIDKAPEIPLGIIRKGLHEENTIIIKNVSLTSDNHPIFFDYLELDDQDEDGDGSLDSEEIEGDIDQDGTENILDPDTATLLIQSKYSEIRKHITLDLQEKDEWGPFFKCLILLDTNSPCIIKKPPDDIFFPYSIFRAHIDIPIEIDTLVISIYTPKDQILYNTLQFYLYEENVWRSIPVEILSQNTLNLSIGLDSDQETKESDFNGDNNKEFIITGGLAYPALLNIDLERRGLCFIRTLLGLKWIFNHCGQD